MPLQTILSMMCSQIYGGIGNKAALRLLTLKGTPVSLQGTCSGLILTDLTPLASTSLVPPDMLSYTVYLGAFQNSTTHSGPNALSFQGCPGTLCTWLSAGATAGFHCIHCFYDGSCFCDPSCAMHRQPLLLQLHCCDTQHMTVVH